MFFIKTFSKFINELEITPNALHQISTDGFDQTYGARPLRRYIQQNIENPIAYKIISSEIKEKSLVIIDYVNDQFVFKVEEKK